MIASSGSDCQRLCICDDFICRECLNTREAPAARPQLPSGPPGSLGWLCVGVGMVLRLLLHWNPALPTGAASGSTPNWGTSGTSHWLSPAQGLEGRALLAGRGRDKGGDLTSQKLLGNAQEGIFSKVWAIILKKPPGPVYEVQAPFLSRGVGSLSPLCPTPHVSLAKVMRFPVCFQK